MVMKNLIIINKIMMQKPMRNIIIIIMITRMKNKLSIMIIIRTVKKILIISKKLVKKIISQMMR